MKIKNFYGVYSSGACFDKMEEDFFSKKNILKITKTITKNLKKMSISSNDLNNKIIMNIGTGREALGLLKFKPKKIFHYDISGPNIKRFNEYIKINSLNTIVNSSQLDLSKNKLPRNKFDFIYLHGIIQHTDHVNKALKNIILSMKVSGKMWFYFYRPGSLNMFLGSLQRKLLQNKKIQTFKKFLEKSYDKNFIDGIMDDCYVPNRQLFYPTTYNKNFKKNFLINYGNTFLKDYDHKVDFLNYHQSVVFFLKKEREKSLVNIVELKRNKDVDVLDKKLYKNKEYNDIFQIINLIKKTQIKKNQDLFDIVVKLGEIKNKVKDIFFNKGKLTKKEFQIVTKDTIKLLK